jgi:two-component system nitrate/nitrite response regulator NarL
MPDARNTVLLVDDHPLLRKGVSQLLELEEDIAVIGEAANGLDAVQLAVQLDPDLVLLDLSMKGMDGIETLVAMRDRGVSSRIVVFTVSDERSDVISALKSGADGYLLKDAEPEVLIESIRRACSGEMVLSEELAQVLALSFRGNNTSAGPWCYCRESSGRAPGPALR